VSATVAAGFLREPSDECSFCGQSTKGLTLVAARRGLARGHGPKNGRQSGLAPTSNSMKKARLRGLGRR
jgi:hypothetical protein